MADAPHADCGDDLGLLIHQTARDEHPEWFTKEN